MEPNPGVPPPKPPSPAPGFVGSLRQLGDGLIATIQDRVTLFSLEFKEEKEQLIQVHLWVTAALCSGLLAIVFASLTIVYLCWERAPLAALVSLTLLYSATGTAIVIGLRRRLRQQPRPFAATLAELEKDRACLLPKT